MTDLHTIQEDIGSSGRFGEFFVGLGLFILAGGLVLWYFGATGTFNGGHGGASADDDAILSAFLYVVTGVGFAIFGAVAILSGWDRHHDHEA